VAEKPNMRFCVGDAGTVDLVKENGAWKLVEAEQWSPKGLAHLRNVLER
jgi:hypothetical protein